ncbi:MAG: ribulose-phosphate 3-epimerase [Bacteroidales bacterium]|nr:ribulose-phosphate 3-epimerase [Bacteroidales bacterium]
MKVKIAPSMLAADFLHLEKSVDIVNKYADMFHLDVMDGSLVPNISFGFPIVEAIAPVAKKMMDAHLMIVHPERYIERFSKVGVKMLSVHYEAVRDPEPILGLIKSFGMKAGLAFNPDVPVEKIIPYLYACDFVLVMSVYAGFGGQKFIEETYDRIRTIKQAIDENKFRCRIEVDGGVSPENAHRLIECGADMLVAGSAVFKAEDPAAVIAAMRP